MTKLRNIVITDNTTEDPAAVNADNQLSVEAEIVDANGRNLELTTESNLPVEVVDSTGKNLDLTDNSNIPIEVFNFDGQVVDVQHPFPTNGDSVYCKDVWQAESVATDWVDADATGEPVICIPFTNLHTRITNTTATNPKILLVHFNRTVFATQVGLGCTSGDFSNAKIILLGSGGVERTLVDDSADNTKRTSRNYTFSKQLFNAVKFEFHTTDDVCLSNITIQKAINVSLSQIEETTNSVQVINYSHAELHSGDRFLHRSYDTVAKNGIAEFLLITPDTLRWSHMTTAVDNSTSEIVVEVFEDATVSANGTPQTVRNRNRNSSKVNTTLVYKTPTVLTDGNSLGSIYLGSGKNLPGGSARDSEEVLLKQDTIYLVRITEQNIAATIFNIAFDWYEHTNIMG